MKDGRMLRSYQRIAQQDHPCWHCPMTILPGDLYFGEVWVRGKHLWVWKYHDSCPWDPREEEEIFREYEEALKDKAEENAPLAMAA